MAHTAGQLADSMTALEAIVNALKGTYEGATGDAAASLGGADKVQAMNNALGKIASITQAKEALMKQADEREEATKLTCMSDIYVETNDHVETDLPLPRTYRLEDFKGDREKCAKEHYACIDWLSRAMTICKKNNLTHAAACEFIRNHCTQDAGRTCSNAITDKKTLTQLVVDLEVNYSGLKHPDIALEACKSLTRRDSEGIRQFGERVRHMAEMACRNKPDASNAATDLGKDSFLGALKPSLKTELRAKLETRRRLGEGPPTFYDLIAEAHTLDETRTANEKVFRGRRDGASGSVRRVEEGDTPIFYSDPDDSGSNDEMSAVIQLVQRLQTSRKPNSSDRSGPRKQRKQQFNTSSQAQNVLMLEQLEQFDDDGEYATILFTPVAERGGRRVRIKDLNVAVGECARCGIAGHRAFGPENAKCPLRMHILRAEPCGSCRKGGHDAAVCPRTQNLEKN